MLIGAPLVKPVASQRVACFAGPCLINENDCFSTVGLWCQA